MQVSSKSKPDLVAADAKTIITEPSDFYSGCYARASLSVYAYDHESGQRGVNFSLQNIQKLRNGDPISGRPRAEAEFEAVESNEDADQPKGAGMNAGGLFD